MSEAASSTGRRVALAGATGLVGGALLRGLLADPAVCEVHALVRRAALPPHPKLTTHVVDFAALPRLPDIDAAYLALGTTIKAAGGRAAFRAVDFDANLAVARAAQAAGARRIALVSAMNANARSSVFYNRVKGELEDALIAMNFDGLVIARPSLLLGDRARLGQPARRLEAISMAAAKWLNPLLPANYRAIPAEQVARALLERTPLAHGVEIILSGAMQR